MYLYSFGLCILPAGTVGRQKAILNLYGFGFQYKTYVRIAELVYLAKVVLSYLQIDNIYSYESKKLYPRFVLCYHIDGC